MKLLAVETSCDETAVSILDIAAFSAHMPARDFLNCELISSQIKLHAPYGGVVPELAAREHIINLPILIKEAFDQTGCQTTDIGAIAVTRGPGLKGCLLVGLSFCKALAYTLKVPLIPVNHLEGHLVAPWLTGETIHFPMLALVVSGGHTLLVYVASFGDYKVLAATRDDAAGEAFDKTATLLGLPYPGGPSLAKLAESGDSSRFRFPPSLPADTRSFSFSGLKTAIARTVKALDESGETQDPKVKADLAAGAQEAIVRQLVSKTVETAKELRPHLVTLGGGVAANSHLRHRLNEELMKGRFRFLVPPPRWCTDNATMIGLAAVLKLEREKDSYSAWTQYPAQGLGPGVPFNLSADPRLHL